MKTYEERTQGVFEKIETMKARKKRTKRLVGAAVAMVLVAALGLVLFVPYDTSAPDVSMYADSPYYSLIQRINEATYERPRYKNNYEKLMAGMTSMSTGKGDMALGIPEMAPGMNGNAARPDLSTGDGQYQEVTDNQVQGVIEGDLFKRSDRYIFYLHQNELKVYTIAEADSRQVGAYTLCVENNATMPLYGAGEMFLSEDCSTITLIYPRVSTRDKQGFVCVQNLDVTDPGNIQEIDHVLITGSENTARMVDGKLLLLTDFYIPYNRDFSDESTFLPQIGKEGDMHSVAAEDIVAPEELSSTQYTVATLLDGKTLEIQGSAAFLSYSDEVYVSRENIFASRGYSVEKDDVRSSMTDISCIRYKDGKLEVLGTATVKGSVKDQYSMDEHQGILRVVTSTNEIKTTINGETASGTLSRNASLWCIDLQDFTIKAQVENFAPAGEQAESVRFDGDTAYVCTAEVITLTDPVYFFDLSDLTNITWKDTGTIDGYSSSLVDFGDGYLLGIGFNEMRQLKVEIYVETADGVESLCSFEMPASFSGVYKSYLIDREGGYVGLGVYNHDNGRTEYLLLKFDGYKLHKLVQEEIFADVSTLRSAMIDGWLYILAEEFKVLNVY